VLYIPFDFRVTEEFVLVTGINLSSISSVSLKTKRKKYINRKYEIIFLQFVVFIGSISQDGLLPPECAIPSPKI
jgi:hypothetical protein